MTVPVPLERMPAAMISEPDAEFLCAGIGERDHALSAAGQFDCGRQGVPAGCVHHRVHVRTDLANVFDESFAVGDGCRAELAQQFVVARVGGGDHGRFA